METKHLCLISGIVPTTTCATYIIMMMKRVCKYLKRDEHAKISFPKTVEAKQELATMIQNRETTITNCIGFIDGFSIPIQCSSDPVEQSILDM